MKRSAGILLYRRKEKILEVFLVHPGGPFWKNKDEGSWSIPKGEYEEGEDALKAAIREFEEETGTKITGDFIELPEIKLRKDKMLKPWIIEKDIEQPFINSNDFEMEWPPKSGKMKKFPEVDNGNWFTVEEAKKKINSSQLKILDKLIEILS